MDITQSWLVKTKIAHRGLHNDKLPENSIAAFLNAAKNGFAIELDVRELKDGSVAVFHDEGLSRMTGADGYLCSLDTNGLKDLRLNKTEEKIPLFGEALEAVNGKAPILIEIKNQNKAGPLEQSVIKLLDGYKGEFAVQAFSPYSLEYFKKNAPHILRGQLSSYFRNVCMSKFRRFALKRMLFNKYTQPDFVAYEFNYLPNRWVAKSGLPVLAWTVRSNAEYEAVKDLCDNIIFESFIPED